MDGDSKFVIKIMLVGDVLNEGVYTLDQLVMGKHKEWFDKVLREYPEATWSVTRLSFR